MRELKLEAMIYDINPVISDNGFGDVFLRFEQYGQHVVPDMTEMEMILLLDEMQKFKRSLRNQCQEMI